VNFADMMFARLLRYVGRAGAMRWKGSGRLKMSEVTGKIKIDKDDENVINAAIAFIDQLNSFNSFLHPEVLKRAKELQNSVGTYWKYNSRMAQGNWRDERDRAFAALTANEFAEWLKTHPEPAESQTFKENTFTSFHRCEWCGEEIAPEPVTIKNSKDFSVVCAECLQWKREDGKVVIAELRNVRLVSMILTDECNPLVVTLTQTPMNAVKVPKTICVFCGGDTYTYYNEYYICIKCGTVQLRHDFYVKWVCPVDGDVALYNIYYSQDGTLRCKQDNEIVEWMVVR
jgi:hypothetical protein